MYAICIAYHCKVKQFCKIISVAFACKSYKYPYIPIYP